MRLSSSARAFQAVSAPPDGRRLSIGRAIALLASVALSAGVLTVLGAGAASALPPTIAAVGGVASPGAPPIDQTGTTGQTTVAVNPTGVGDAVVLGIRITSASVTVSSISGGGAGSSWTKLQSDNSDGVHDVELWLGTVATAGAANATITYSSAIGATPVEIVGQEFSSGLGASTVWARDTSGTSVNASSTTVTYPPLTPAGTHELYAGYAVVVNVGAAGSTAGYTYNLTTTNNNIFAYNTNIGAATAPTASQNIAGTSIAEGALITATAPPTVTAVAPATGPAAGGTPVTITGTNFTGATAVHFGATAATGVSVTNDTTITATSPAGSGVQDVTVTTPAGTSATGAADKFTYQAAVAAPTVTGLSPSAGSLNGGTSVTITGTNLTGATAVKFGTTAAAGFTVNSATQISAVSPAGTGSVDVTVTTPGGTSATTSADKYQFTYGGGYWMVGSDGGVFAFGTATFKGSLPGLHVTVKNIVGVVPTSTGNGYWMVGKDGGVFAFGDATYLGSLPGDHVTVSNIVGVVPTHDNGGYWMVGSDGGVFAFGDATFKGSLPGLHVTVNNVRAVVPTSTGNGYWMIGSDGGAFAFGDAGFVGSLPGLHVTVNNVVGAVGTPDNQGYWMAGSDGGVFAFGDAGFVGSLPGLGVHVNNIVGVVPA